MDYIEAHYFLVLMVMTCSQYTMAWSLVEAAGAVPLLAAAPLYSHCGLAGAATTTLLAGFVLAIR